MSRSLAIALRNFQSIKSAKVDLVPGVTIITGPNNSGKTAVFRAIKSLINNTATARRYIKKGESKTRVGLRIDGGEPIIWTRTQSESTYEIGTNLNSKAGRNDIYDFLPSFPILRDDNKDILHLHEEGDLPFPFGKSATEMFAMFEDLFQVGNTALILSDIKANLSREKDDKVNLESGRVKIKFKVESIEQFLTMVPEKELNDNIDRITKCLNYLVDVVKEIENAEALDRLIPKDVIEPMVVVSISDCDDMLVDLKVLEGLESSLVGEVLEVCEMGVFDFYPEELIKDLGVLVEVEKELQVSPPDAFEMVGVEEDKFEQMEQDAVQLALLEKNLIDSTVSEESFTVDLLACKEEIAGYTNCPLCNQSLGECNESFN